jgi:prefoldin beta subunit
MDVDKETEQQIQELQMLEQTLQSLVMQKQQLELESSEIENALTEISKTKKDTYKVIGQIMIACEKEDLEKELSEKKKLIALRLKTLDSQEVQLSEKSEELRKTVLAKVGK